MSRSARQNTDLAAKNLKKTQEAEGRSEELEESSTSFVQHAKSLALKRKGWKVLLKDLKTASDDYDKNPSAENFQKFQEALNDICQFQREKEQDKNQVYNLREQSTHAQEIEKYKTKIGVAFMSRFVYSEASVPVVDESKIATQSRIREIKEKHSKEKETDETAETAHLIKPSPASTSSESRYTIFNCCRPPKRPREEKVKKPKYTRLGS